MPSGAPLAVHATGNRQLLVRQTSFKFYLHPTWMYYRCCR